MYTDDTIFLFDQTLTVLCVFAESNQCHLCGEWRGRAGFETPATQLQPLAAVQPRRLPLLTGTLANLVYPSRPTQWYKSNRSANIHYKIKVYNQFSFVD